MTWPPGCILRLDALGRESTRWMCSQKISLEQLHSIAEMLQTLEVVGAGPPNHPADAVSLFQQQVRQVAAVLTCNAGNESGFRCHPWPRVSAGSVICTACNR